MNLFDKIGGDLIAAMKAHEKEKLETIRNIKKALIEARAAKGAGSELTDDEVLKVIGKLAKQGRDAASIYREQGRDDLYSQEMFQVNILESYLPAQLSPEEVGNYLKNLIQKMGISTIKEMGRAMGTATRELAGKASGKEISDKLKELLQ